VERGFQWPAGVRRAAVWACCGVPDPARVARGVAVLEGFGLSVDVHTCVVHPVRYLAASDAERVGALNGLLSQTPPPDVIFAVRGGFGCARLLEHVCWTRLKESGVRVVGFSDVTAFHLAAFAYGIRSGVSGPLLTFPLGCELRTPEDRASLRFTLMSLADAMRPGMHCVRLPAGTGLSVLQEGVAEGPVVAANLTVLTSLLGTPWFPPLTGCILVVEDVREAAYRIDRCLTQLRLSGVLERLAGLVYGDFRECEDAEWIPEVLAEFAGHVSGPVVSGLPYGHCFPMVSVPVGRPGRMVADASGGEVRLWWL